MKLIRTGGRSYLLTGISQVELAHLQLLLIQAGHSELRTGEEYTFAGWAPEPAPCPACGAGPGEPHGCTTAERSRQADDDEYAAADALRVIDDLLRPDPWQQAQAHNPRHYDGRMHP